MHEPSLVQNISSLNSSILLEIDCSPEVVLFYGSFFVFWLLDVLMARLYF